MLKPRHWRRRAGSPVETALSSCDIRKDDHDRYAGRNALARYLRAGTDFRRPIPFAILRAMTNTAAAEHFASARLKIKRAQTHIDEVELLEKAFLANNYEVRFSVDASGMQEIKLASLGRPSAEMGLVIGDAVHNLRSALDHSMVSILGARGNQISFPLAKDKSNPGAHSTYPIIKKEMPGLALLLTDTIVIHDTGLACLWAIGALDNIDKHNLLIAVGSVHELHGLVLEDIEHQSVIAPSVVYVKPGGILDIGNWAGQMTVTSPGTPVGYVMFADGQPLEGTAVVPCLRNLVGITARAIDKIEDFIARRDR
jgi:hypothetical protein